MIMKILGKELKEVDKGYFGIRRCTICNNKLRDVNLIEIHATNYFCFIPVKDTIVKRILLCSHCKAYMEINDKLWNYYSSYYNDRLDKTTTDNIVNVLDEVSADISHNGVALSIEDDTSQQSLDLIYKGLCQKYGCPENIEEIVSVYYK